MTRNIEAVLVRNQFGCLNRVTSMFRRRQFNISTLTVSETETPEYSRITVTFDGDENSKQQLINQLYKLPDVCYIEELTGERSVNMELLLIKVADSEKRSEIFAAADRFGAETSDISGGAIIFRLTDDSKYIDEFINVMRDYKILEICRTGLVSLQRGQSTIRTINN